MSIPKDFAGELDEKKIAALTDYIPNSWQKKVEAVDARFKTIVVGRRGGKTLYVVRSPKDGLVRDLLTPNQHVWVVAPNYDLTQRVWNDFYRICMDKFPRDFFIKINNTKGNYFIETVLGTVIEAKSADDPESLIGVGLTKIIIDEASRVKEKAWYQALRPTLADHKGRAIFISTPRGKNWFYDLYRKGANLKKSEFSSTELNTNKNYASFHFTSYDNNYIDKQEIDDMAEDMPEYEYQQEIMADFREAAEQIFKLERIKRADGLAEPVEKGIRTMGIDLGKGMSYSVITGLNEDGSCYYFRRFRLDWNETVKIIKETVAKYEPHYCQIDATGKGDPIVEQLQLAGVPVDPFVFTGVTKKQLLDKASLVIEKSMITLPKNERILYEELESYGREFTEKGNVIYRQMKKITDDCVMSLALAIWNMDIQEEGFVAEKAVEYPIVEY